MTVSELLNTESQWGQGMSMGRQGKICLLEAVYATYPGDRAYYKVRDLIRNYLGFGPDNPFQSIALWNDHPRRTFADIRQVIEALNI